MNDAAKRIGRAHYAEIQPGVLRVRSDGKRLYAEDVKAELVRQCLLPGTSVAATAMAHRINANLLRCWIGLQVTRSDALPSPVALLTVIVKAHFAASHEPAAPTHSSATTELIEMDFYGARVCLHGTVDAKRLGVMLEALAQCT